MNKPHWEKIHDWHIEDITYELKQIWEFKQMLKRHPDDEMGDIFRELIKTCKTKLSGLIKIYEKTYGDKPNVAGIRREVESEGVKNDV